jgi:hypothetical protein
VPWYCRVLSAINVAAPFLAPTQAANLALLVSAILKKRTLCLSELARAYPTPKERRVASPKHDLLHRIKRLWRFIGNERVNALGVQTTLVPYTIARLGSPRLLGLAIDWTMFDAVLPSGERVRYQVLRIAVPRKGRALPLLQLAYDRDDLPATKSQNQIEQEALLAVVGVLPIGVRPVLSWPIEASTGPASSPGSSTPSPRLRGAHQEGQLHNRDRWTEVEVGRGRAEARRAALRGGGALRSLPRASPRPSDQCGSMLEGLEKPGDEPSTQTARGALVSGHQPRQREECRLLVLAKELDRAVLQRRQEPLRSLRGQGRHARAPGAAAYGAHHRPLVADAHGTARERRPVARGLPLGGCRLGESEPDRLGALAPGEARGSAATLSTSTTASGVGGYASGT